MRGPAGSSLQAGPRQSLAWRREIPTFSSIIFLPKGAPAAAAYFFALSVRNPCCSHINSHDQVRGHMQHPKCKVFERPRHEARSTRRKPGQRVDMIGCGVFLHTWSSDCLFFKDYFYEAVVQHVTYVTDFCRVGRGIVYPSRGTTRRTCQFSGTGVVAALQPVK